MRRGVFWVQRTPFKLIKFNAPLTRNDGPKFSRQTSTLFTLSSVFYALMMSLLLVALLFYKFFYCDGVYVHNVVIF